MTDASAPPPSQRPVIIIMGVTGSGKTTIGELLAERVKMSFYDADDYHPPANQEKLSDDVPLSDADREPWMELLVAQVQQWGSDDGAVLACSALKHSYRSRFRRATSNVRFVFLHGEPELIAGRLKKRSAKGEHVVKDFKAILHGQYCDLEIPTDALRVDIDQTPEQIVNDILGVLSAPSAS